MAYYCGQVRQSWAKRAKPPHPHFDRLAGFVSGPVLCVGSRNRQEPEAWRRLGYEAVAVDLLPSLGVQCVDFHFLPFAADAFATVYASHAWEHALNPQRALAEATRVLRRGGHLFAAFPVGFVLSRHDLVDYGSVQGFMDHLPPTASWERVWSVERRPVNAPGEVAVLLRLEGK